MAHVLHLGGLIMTLTLVTMPSAAGNREAEELKCLDERVAYQCNLDLTAVGEDFPLPCDLFLTRQQALSLASLPDMVVLETEGLQLPMQVLVVMYDIDAPEEPDHPADGWMHWVAIATLDENGKVKVNSTVRGKNYHGPNPPRGAIHRYQFIVFEYAGGIEDIVVQRRRVDQLCRFMAKNRLGQPVAATQIRYETL